MTASAATAAAIAPVEPRTASTAPGELTAALRGEADAVEPRGHASAIGEQLLGDVQAPGASSPGSGPGHR